MKIPELCRWQITSHPCHHFFKSRHLLNAVGLAVFNRGTVVSWCVKAAKGRAIIFFKTGKFVGKCLVIQFGMVQSQSRILNDLFLCVRYIFFWPINECTNAKCCHKSTIPLSARDTGKHHSTEKNLQENDQVVYPSPKCSRVFFHSKRVDESEFLLVAFHRFPLTGRFSSVEEAVVVYELGCVSFSRYSLCTPFPDYLVANSSYWLLSGLTTSRASLLGLVQQNRVPDQLATSFN